MILIRLKESNQLFHLKNRFEIVKSIKYVDLTIAETCWEQKLDDIKKFNVDYLVMGDDWKGKFDEFKNYCEVIYLPRTEGISSSLLKNSLSEIKNINLSHLNNALELLNLFKNQLF